MRFEYDESGFWWLHVVWFAMQLGCGNALLRLAGRRSETKCDDCALDEMIEVDVVLFDFAVGVAVSHRPSVGSSFEFKFS